MQERICFDLASGIVVLAGFLLTAEEWRNLEGTTRAELVANCLPEVFDPLTYRQDPGDGATHPKR